MSPLVKLSNRAKKMSDTQLVTNYRPNSGRLLQPIVCLQSVDVMEMMMIRVMVMVVVVMVVAM